MKLKKVGLLATIFLSFLMVEAQEYPAMQNAKWVSFSGAYSNPQSPNSKGRNTNIVFGSNFNYLIADHIYMGGGLNYVLSKSGSINTSQVGFGGQLGVVFGDEDFSVYPYVDITGRYGLSNSKNRGSSYVNKGKYYFVSGVVGMLVPFSNHLGLVLEGSYRHEGMVKSSRTNPKNNYITFSFGLIGLLY